MTEGQNIFFFFLFFLSWFFFSFSFFLLLTLIKFCVVRRVDPLRLECIPIYYLSRRMAYLENPLTTDLQKKAARSVLICVEIDRFITTITTQLVLNGHHFPTFSSSFPFDSLQLLNYLERISSPVSIYQF